MLIDPVHPVANFILGSIYEQREQFDEAIKCYRQSVKGDPASPAAARLVALTMRK